MIYSLLFRDIIKANNFLKCTLKLLNEFNDDIEEIITNLKYDYIENKASTPQKFLDILKQRANRFEQECGINNYVVVLYKEIINNPAVFNYIIK